MKTGMVFGCFDLFHIGHLNFLYQAKLLCEYLIVCVNEENYIRSYKDTKVAIPLAARMKIVEHIDFVDKVDEQSKERDKEFLIDLYKPDLLIAADCYTETSYPGAGFGVPVKFVKYTHGVSSSSIKKKIKCV